MGDLTDEIEWYKNGSPLESDASAKTNIYNPTAEIEVGSYDDGSSPFDGRLDEVGAFTRALSATEVGEICTNGISGNTGGND